MAKNARTFEEEMDPLGLVPPEIKGNAKTSIFEHLSVSKQDPKKCGVGFPNRTLHRGTSKQATFGTGKSTQLVAWVTGAHYQS